MISVRKLYFPITTLGPGKRIGLWTQGCNHACPGCIEPKMWKFDDEYNVSVSDVLLQIQQLLEENEVHGITISGGDPLMQKDLLDLLKGIKNLGIDDLLLYTGFTYEEILRNTEYSKLLPYITVLIDGLYVDELNDNHPLRGSSNQRIIFLNQSFIPRYNEYLKKNREIQFIVDQGTYSLIGIPPKGFQDKYQDYKIKKYGGESK